MANAKTVHGMRLLQKMVRIVWHVLVDLSSMTREVHVWNVKITRCQKMIMQAVINLHAKRDSDFCQMALVKTVKIMKQCWRT